MKAIYPITCFVFTVVSLYLLLKKIRHYQVLRVLGQGGMGTTYLAWDSAGINTGAPHF